MVWRNLKISFITLENPKVAMMKQSSGTSLQSDPVREYKRMMSKAKRLDIRALVDKGYPDGRVEKRILERGYLCTVETSSGLQVTIKFDRNDRFHVHLMVQGFDLLDYRISYCGEGAVSDAVVAINSLGEKYRRSCRQVKEFLKDFYSIPIEKVTTMYHAWLISEDEGWLNAAAEKIQYQLWRELF